MKSKQIWHKKDKPSPNSHPYTISNNNLSNQVMLGIISKCMGTLPKVQKKKTEKKVSEVASSDEPLRSSEKVVFNP